MDRIFFSDDYSIHCPPPPSVDHLDHILVSTLVFGFNKALQYLDFYRIIPFLSHLEASWADSVAMHPPPPSSPTSHMPVLTH